MTRLAAVCAFQLFARQCSWDGVRVRASWCTKHTPDTHFNALAEPRASEFSDKYEHALDYSTALRCRLVFCGFIFLEMVFMC